MVSFMIMFFPPVLSVWIHEALSKTEPKPKTWVMLYITSTLVVNLCCMMIMSSVLGGGEIALDSLANGLFIGVAVIYLLLALPVSVLFGVVITYIKKNLRIEIEEPEDGEA